MQTFEIKITRQDIDQAQSELGPRTPSGISTGRSPLLVALDRMGVSWDQSHSMVFYTKGGEWIGCYNPSKAFTNAACYWMARDGRVSQKPAVITLKGGIL